MAATQETTASFSMSERLSVTVNGLAINQTKTTGDAADEPASTQVSLSQAAQDWLAKLQAGDEQTTRAPTSGLGNLIAKPKTDETQAAVDDPLSNVEPNMRLLAMLIAQLTGQPVRVMIMTPGTAQTATGSNAPAASASTATANTGSTNWNVSYAQTTTQTVTESSSFSAQGVIRTADGQEIRFNLALAMQSSQSRTTSFSFNANNTPATLSLQQPTNNYAVAHNIDPLVLNFNGTAAQLQSTRFSFDLDGDGTTEDVPLLASGSGYLALDKNGNGQIDNGTELFGPANGDGFADLAQYDDDHNGWIDENDAIYSSLRIWTPDAQGQGSLKALADLDVGAIYLGNVATPLAVRSKDASAQQLGELTATGIYLRNNGTVGTVQNLDVVV
jgi:hypothetical protein